MKTLSQILNESLNEANDKKIYYIKHSTKDGDLFYSGTLEYLCEVAFAERLKKGNSYDHNIKLKHNSLMSLIKSLNRSKNVLDRYFSTFNILTKEEYDEQESKKGK